MTVEPPRYVVDGRFLAGRPTGLHRVARAYVAAGRHVGVDLEVWAPSGTTDPLVDRTVRTPGGRAGGRLWEQVVLPILCRRRPIWSLTNTAPLVRPGVVIVHDLAPVVGPEWFASSMQWYARLVVTGARRALRVITVSGAVRDELVSAGVDPGRIAVVPPAVDPRFVPASAAAVAAVRHRYRLDRPYAVMTGWADPRKDVGTAIAAHRRVVTDIAHDLVLLGTTHPTFAPVELPDLRSIRRLGHVDDDDLVALLSGAHLLLYPSRYEGFGLPPLEALSCGTPAVGSDIPALWESTQGVIPLLPVGDVEAWTSALRAGLSGELACPPPPQGSRSEWEQRLAAALSMPSASTPHR